MSSYKIILRTKSSPYNLGNDVTKNSVLSWQNLDNNFINLKGKLSEQVDVVGNDLVIKKVDGSKITTDLSGIINTQDTYVTGGTYDNSTGFITFFDNDGNDFDVDLGTIDLNDTHVTGGTYDNSAGIITFEKKDGNDFDVDISSLDLNDTFTTAATLNNNTLVFDTTDQLSAYTVDLSQFIFTGNTSGNCIENLYVSNIHGCSPITFHSELQHSGSTATTRFNTAFGYKTLASGQYSHAEGFHNTASGDYSHAENGGVDELDSSIIYNNIAKGESSHAEGAGTVATGRTAHAEGKFSKAYGENSHAEGENTIASARRAHSEGVQAEASGFASHAEGNTTEASGNNSHSEGSTTKARATNSHAEGSNTLTTPLANNAHAEGDSTEASGNDSHAEGSDTIASGDQSHAEGNLTIASGDQSHSQGVRTKSSGNYSHASGFIHDISSGILEASGEASFAHFYANFLYTGSGATADRSAILGGLNHQIDSNATNSAIIGGENITATTDDTVYVPNFNINYNPSTNNNLSEILVRDNNGDVFLRNAQSIADSFTGNTSGSCIEDLYVSNIHGCSPITIHDEMQHSGSTATTRFNTAFGYKTLASGQYSHAEGYANIASGNNSHAEGGRLEDEFSLTARTLNNIASGIASHAEGQNNEASGEASHVEGGRVDEDVAIPGGGNVATGLAAHAEGLNTQAKTIAAHAEGYGANANGRWSHAEGDGTHTNADGAHAEGELTNALGNASHAEGYLTEASGQYSHSEGYVTFAIGDRSHAEGDFTFATGRTSHSQNMRTEAYGDYSHAGGYGGERYIKASGLASFNHSKIDGFADKLGATGISSAILGGSNHETLSDYSGIFGGTGNTVNTGSTASVILGGEGNITNSNFSSIENGLNETRGDYSHAEGYNTIAGLQQEEITETETISSGGTVTEGNIEQGFFEITDPFDDQDCQEWRNRIGSTDFDLVGGSGGTDCVLNITIEDVQCEVGSSLIIEYSSTDVPSEEICQDISVYTAITGTVTTVLQQGYNNTICHSEGEDTIATGKTSHAEGFQTKAIGDYTHSEGYQTEARFSSYSHSEGYSTSARGDASHAEGDRTFVNGFAAHVEGSNNTASGNHSHAEGRNTEVNSDATNSHAEGNQAIINGAPDSHAEGHNTIIEADPEIGVGLHVEGFNSIIGEPNIENYFIETVDIRGAHAEGDTTRSLNNGTHSEGKYTHAVGVGSHSGGLGTSNNNPVIAIGNVSFNHSEIDTNYSESGAEGDRSAILGGLNQSIKPEAVNSGIIGGNSNIILQSSSNSIVGGGTNNSVSTNKAGIFVGDNNTIQIGNNIDTDVPERSAIVGGQNNLMLNNDSVILGGVGITADTAETAYVPNLNINYSPSTDNNISEILVRDGNGDVQLRDAQSIADSFTGNTSGSCIEDLYVSNIHGCSPITIHDEMQHSGSTATTRFNTAFGYKTLASGQYSHAEGFSNVASGEGSHAEGGVMGEKGGPYPNVASGNGSHAEGSDTVATGLTAHAEGGSTKASGDYSHAEGSQAIASGGGSHAEGSRVTASGKAAHAEGSNTIASEGNSHAEGSRVTASGKAAHAEGSNTIASEQNSHAEGNLTEASGRDAHAEGNLTKAIGDSSHAGGRGISDVQAGQFYVRANAQSAFNHSEVDSNFGGTGAEGRASAILGGLNHQINSNANNSAIIGGQNITADTPDTAYVPNLNIDSEPSNGTTSGTTVLARNDSTGDVEELTQKQITNSSKYAETIPNASATTYTINHNLEDTDIIVQLWDDTNNEVIGGNIENRQLNSVDVSFDTDPNVDVRVVVKV